jgi:hypothetical protein
MTPLRQRFIKDMTLAGLMPGTQAAYIDIIVKFVRHCGDVPPQAMTEQQVEQYIDNRLDTIARGTFQVEFAALKALFYRTLGRDWAIFTKKKCDAPDGSDCLLLNPTRTVANSLPLSSIRSIGPV